MFSYGSKVLDMEAEVQRVPSFLRLSGNQRKPA